MEKEETVCSRKSKNLIRPLGELFRRISERSKSVDDDAGTDAAKVE